MRGRLTSQTKMSSFSPNSNPCKFPFLISSYNYFGQFGHFEHLLRLNSRRVHWIHFDRIQELGFGQACCATSSVHRIDAFRIQSRFRIRNAVEVTVSVIRYNFVQVLEVSRRADHALAGCRLLLLDRPGNIQSVYNPYKVVTDSYYDILATLPPLLPDGPVGVLGLGAGTAARIIHYFWPHVELHGWELDPSVVMVARQFFDLSELEEGKRLDRRASVFELGGQEDSSPGTPNF